MAAPESGGRTEPLTTDDLEFEPVAATAENPPSTPLEDMRAEISIEEFLSDLDQDEQHRAACEILGLNPKALERMRAHDEMRRMVNPDTIIGRSVLEYIVKILERRASALGVTDLKRRS